MAYQSKTYSLSDEVIAAIEAAKEAGLSPNQFILGLMARNGVPVERPVPTPREPKPVGTPRKQSKKARVAEELRASDPLAAERDDIDYMNPDQLPSAGSVGLPRPDDGRGVKIETRESFTDWRANRKPIPKPKERK